MTIKLTIDQSGLTLDNIVLTDSCAAIGACIGDGLIRPSFQPRKTYAPDSRYIGGKQLMSVVKDAAELTVPLLVRGINNVDVEARILTLEHALWQFTYTVTLELDGALFTYNAEPCIPVWGRVFVGQMRTYSRAGQLAIPVNPT